MNEIWIVWCDGDSYARVRGEIVNRLTAPGAPTPQFARVDCGEDAAGLARAMGVDRVHVAIEVTAGRLDACEATIELLIEAGATGKVVALVDRPDPGMVARCFLAGATEVIAAGEAEDYGGINAKTGARKGLIALQETPSPAVDDSCVTGGARGAPSWIELDEPDGTDVADGGGMRGPLECGASLREGTPRAGSAPVPRVLEGGGTAMEAEGRAGVLQGRGAPVVTVVSGRGGSGKSTLVASMAACAARTGLRAAVLDLDLMFGNLHEVFGVEGLKGLETLRDGAQGAALTEEAVERTAMRIGPGLTLWGPCASPELAELCSQPIEGLMRALRELADVIFVDTSNLWGDAVAMAISSCDRCLIVGGVGASAATSGRRAVELVARLGVPYTKMTCVFNRLGAKGCGEEQALAFELGTTLRSRARIADGGEEVASMLSFGCVDELVAGPGAFAKSVRLFTGSLLGELGYPMARKILAEETGQRAEEGQRFHLPWHRRAGEVA